MKSPGRPSTDRGSSPFVTLLDQVPSMYAMAIG